MPVLKIKMDVDECGFDAVNPDGSGAEKIVHVPDAVIEVGTLRAGMTSGKDSVMICVPLPDGRIVLAETSAELFVAAGRAITGWQEGRRERGEG